MFARPFNLQDIATDSLDIEMLNTTSLLLENIIDPSVPEIYTCAHKQIIQFLGSGCYHTES